MQVAAVVVGGAVALEAVVAVAAALIPPHPVVHPLTSVAVTMAVEQVEGIIRYGCENSESFKN